MNISLASVISILTVFALAITGCADLSHQNLTLDQEIERGKVAAIAAVDSASTWDHVRGKRLTRQPYKLDATRVRYRFYEAQMDTVSYRQGEPLIIFTVPTGVRYGMHSTFVDVTVRRDTSEVLCMHEFFYP
jgi:hypothetical protein